MVNNLTKMRSAVKKNINDLEPTDMIFDLGPETMKGITQNLKQSKPFYGMGR